MEAQTLNSAQLRKCIEKKTDSTSNLVDVTDIDPSILLSSIQEKITKTNHIDTELGGLIYNWQSYVKNNPIDFPDPFPDYIDPSSITEEDFPIILDRINAIMGIKKSIPKVFQKAGAAGLKDQDVDIGSTQFLKHDGSSLKKEPNSRLEYIDLFDKYSNLQSEVLDRLGSEETHIYEEVKHCDYLRTELSKLESEARANGKNTIIIDADLQEKIREFQTIDWPRIKERNNLAEDRNPFDLSKDFSSIKVDDVSTIQSRSSLITSQLNQNLSQNVREIERITRKLGHLIDIVSHYNNRDTFIDRCIRGQTQR